MKVEIDTDEYYPYHSIQEANNSKSGIIDIPIEKFVWVNRVLKEFEEVQAYMQNLTNPPIPQPDPPTPEQLATREASLSEAKDRAAQILRDRNA